MTVLWWEGIRVRVQVHVRVRELVGSPWRTLVKREERSHREGLRHRVEEGWLGTLVDAMSGVDLRVVVGVVTVVAIPAMAEMAALAALVVVVR